MVHLAAAVVPFMSGRGLGNASSATSHPRRPEQHARFEPRSTPPTGQDRAQERPARLRRWSVAVQEADGT
jgi:hypothetical protein